MHEDTKSKILRATRTLIDEEGLEAVTLRAVGIEGGLSRGAAYRHFTNKNDLLAAIALEDFEMLTKSFALLEDSQLSPEEFLSEALQKYYTFGVSNRVHYQLMFTTPWSEEEYPVLHEKAKLAFEFFNRIIIKLPFANEIPADNAASRTAIMFAFIHGLVELHLAGHKEKTKALHDPKTLISIFIRQILSN